MFEDDIDALFEPSREQLNNLAYLIILEEMAGNDTTDLRNRYDKLYKEFQNIN